MQRRRITGLWAARDGLSTIEFAFVSGILCILVLGVVDFGLGFWEYMQVQSAVQAGAQYSMLNPGASNSSINSAVTGATGLSGISVTSGYPQKSCGCPTGSSSAPTGMTFGLTCGSTCSVGGTAQQYILIKAQVSYRTFMTWPGLNNPMTLASTGYTLY
jgi:Flp pilus assembly protein TadG